MKKKLKIEFDIHSEYTLFGISSQLKDYRLAFHINNDLKFKFKRLDDLHYANGKISEGNKFSFYYYFDEDSHQTFFLISNKNKNGILLSSTKQMDYFFIIKDDIKTTKKQQILSLIRNIKNVQAVLELDIQKIKNVDFLLSDIELHFNELKRRKKENIIKPV